MIPDDEVPWERLAAYFANEAAPADARRIEVWAAGSPGRAALLAELRRVWAAAGGEVPAPDVEAALARLSQRAAAEGARSPAQHEPRFQMARTARPARRALLAAGIAALVLGGWWLAEYPGARRTAETPTPAAGREYATARGQRLQLTLPDGSGVLLGPESALGLAPDYGISGRGVTLTGEGYFTVVHEVTRPFEVVTAHGVARDLGTRFVVRARPSEPTIRVVVAEGVVALGTRTDLAGKARPSVARPLAADSVVLGRADLGEVAATGKVTSRHGVDLARSLAWTEGRLAFSGTPLVVLAAELERWYDVQIVLAGRGLTDRTFTGSFGGEPVTQVLEEISVSVGAALERDGRRFILRGR